MRPYILEKIKTTQSIAYKKLSKFSTMLISLAIMTFGALGWSQSNMPEDTYATIMEANSLMISNPRRALTLLHEVKKTFHSKSNFENTDDFILYNMAVINQNSIYSLMENRRRIFMNLRELQSNIKPFITDDDSYASAYFLSKFSILVYKAEEKGEILYQNRKYYSALVGLREEVSAFSFKEKINQDAVLGTINSFLKKNN